MCIHCRLGRYLASTGRDRGRGAALIVGFWRLLLLPPFGCEFDLLGVQLIVVCHSLCFDQAAILSGVPAAEIVWAYTQPPTELVSLLDGRPWQIMKDWLVSQQPIPLACVLVLDENHGMLCFWCALLTLVDSVFPKRFLWRLPSK